MPLTLWWATPIRWSRLLSFGIIVRNVVRVTFPADWRAISLCIFGGSRFSELVHPRHGHRSYFYTISARIHIIHPSSLPLHITGRTNQGNRRRGLKISLRSGVSVSQPRTTDSQSSAMSVWQHTICVCGCNQEQVPECYLCENEVHGWWMCR